MTSSASLAIIAVIVIFLITILKNSVRYLRIVSNFPPGKLHGQLYNIYCGLLLLRMLYIAYLFFSSLGPIGFPLVGYLPLLDVNNLGRSFQRISKRYGDIFSIMVGMKPLVVLNSWSAIKEAMAMKELSGRPGMFSGTFFQKGKTGRNIFSFFLQN